MSHHFDGIEGAHRRIGGCTASLFHFYDRLLFTTGSYLPLASITVFNAKLGARYLPQPALF